MRDYRQRPLTYRRFKKIVKKKFADKKSKYKRYGRKIAALIRPKGKIPKENINTVRKTVITRTVTEKTVRTSVSDSSKVKSNRVNQANKDKSVETNRTNAAMDLYSFIQSIVQSVVTAFLLLTFFFSISVVVGSSMNPTLEEGDRLLVTHGDYTLQYGDIIAVWSAHLNNRETGEKGEMIVKRVIGLPGDVINIDDEGTVYRNGEALQEDYIAPFDTYTNKGNAEFPLTVDENCVFVLGDNRNHSTDSRFVDTGNSEIYIGCIDQRYIMGKAVFRLYPYDRMGVIE